ncbi:MAG: lamin tail domain-containing protein [Phycisphaerales bacterium]|nr:MAG: lamin tail domain-containing protein [Phycisphaerales bacterium]
MTDVGRHWCVLPAIVCVFTLCLTRPSSALVVSEVMYHPVDGGEALEFIELYNNRAVFEDLTGYAFTNGIQYTFEPGTIIGAKEYLVVARDPAALEAVYEITGVYGPFTSRLSNDGERVELSNGNGEIIISFRYDDEIPWPAAPDGTGHSLILAKPGGDPDEASTWSPSTFIGGTPGAPDTIQAEPEDPTLVTLVDVGHPGRYFKGTEEPSPGAGSKPTTDWTELGFNDDPKTTDWIDGPSGYGYSNESEELQWVRTQLNDMRENYISVYARLRFTLTQEQIDSFSQLRAEVYYDDGFVLYLNGSRAAEPTNLSGNPPAFSQDASGASDYAGQNVDLTGLMGQLVVGTNVLAIQAHNANIGGSSDCIACPLLRAIIADEPDGGEDPRARVVINELLANSDAPPGTDWIELYNPGPSTVDLSNVYLSDDRDELLQYKIPDGIVLEPGEFWAVHEGTPPDGIPFGLDFAGQTVYVTAATNDPAPEPVRVLDAVRYGAARADVTFGRFPDGSDYFGFLSSGTFGGPNAQPQVDDIVINEIMYHHGTRDERYEYIELHNQGTDTVSLSGWAFTDGITYEFADGIEMPAGSYLVVAKDPNLLETVYDNLVKGSNLLGPYVGGLDDHSERIQLSYPLKELNPDTDELEVHWVTVDEVTYYDGGRWPSWADGQGASLELRDPGSNNDAPDAWADSDESGKTTWKRFSYTISSTDGNYTHDQVTTFGLMLLNRGEVLIDDLELIIGSNRLSNSGFENGGTGWRMLGNHVRSFVTSEDSHSGSRSLHLISTGHGDPGANRINQSIASTTAGTVTFSGWARWLRGSRYLLLRTTRDQRPVQPPRPARDFELDMPMDLGTPGKQNTAFVPNRGPDVLEVRHAPVLPADSEPIVVTARVVDNDGVGPVMLHYRSEGAAFTTTPMVDDASGDDFIAGDGIFTGTIPGAPGGTMRAFYVVASDGSATTRFPSVLDPTADVPDRTCLVRVGDSLLSTRFATYRIWLSNDVISTFTSRPNLSNELLDCTFVCNGTEVFYNARIRYRGSPFIRSGANRNPRDRYAYRIDFNPDQRFGGREEINLDNTEGGNRGPLQERASYWFYRQMGLQFSMQEFVRPIINGRNNGIYEDVQKIDGDYIRAWFPDDIDGYIHKIDDYFEYSADGTGFSNLDEGLHYDSRHPLLKETYRWGFEKRSHRESDNWGHLFDFAVALNTPSSSSSYEQAIEMVIHPQHFAKVLALRHAVGDWDSYGYRRGKNNYFYYAPQESKWYLLPWDIDFTLGSGDGSGTNLFSVGGQFPEVSRFLNYPKYRQMYLSALAQLVKGPWRTSYGTGDPPTAFDLFLDDAANALIADGLGSGRRDGIKAFVRDRRAYILTQVPAIDFEITTNGGDDFCTPAPIVVIEGIAPLGVVGIAVNGEPVISEFAGNNEFEAFVLIEEGVNTLNLQGLDSMGNPVDEATDSITVIRIHRCEVTSVAPSSLCNRGTTQLTVRGSGFDPGSTTSVSLALTGASEDIGFDALYVRSSEAFDRIDAATLLLDDPGRGVGDPTHAIHYWINLWNSGDDHGEFTAYEQTFAPPFNVNGTNYAVRFIGYIYAPSPGKRYFGVNSDDGFSLWIDGKLVGEYADARAPATTDVTQNRTAGTMTFDFPAAGSYLVVLDFYQNGGGEEIEFFQTNSVGGNRRLINIDSELLVYRDDVTQIEATNVVVEDANTITCQVDVDDAEPGTWNVVVTPQCGEASRCTLDGGLQIVACSFDFNGDSMVNYLDWAEFAEKWRKPCSEPDFCSGMDLDQNGRVDAEDLAIFVQEWLVADSEP